MKAKEESFEQLQNSVAQLGDKSADHPIHKSVGEATQHYHDLDNAVKSRTKMLSEFKPRVLEYEREVETFTQWLSDCCKRVDQPLVPDMPTNGVQHQLDRIEVEWFSVNIVCMHLVCTLHTCAHPFFWIVS